MTSKTIETELDLATKRLEQRAQEVDGNGKMSEGYRRRFAADIRLVLAALSRAPEAEDTFPHPREVECVTYESGFREPADPVWYLEVGGFVAEFSTELAANNFRSAVLAALSPPSTGGADAASTLAQKMWGVTLVPIAPVHPSPEMGEISRERAFELISAAYSDGCQAVHDNYQPDPDPEFGEAACDYAESVLSKLNIDEGLLGEGDRGSARAGSGAAGPSDCAEGDARRSDGGDHG